MATIRGMLGDDQREGTGPRDGRGVLWDADILNGLDDDRFGGGDDDDRSGGGYRPGPELVVATGGGDLLAVDLETGAVARVAEGLVGGAEGLGVPGWGVDDTGAYYTAARTSAAPEPHRWTPEEGLVEIDAVPGPASAYGPPLGLAGFEFLEYQGDIYFVGADRYEATLPDYGAEGLGYYRYDPETGEVGYAAPIAAPLPYGEVSQITWYSQRFDHVVADGRLYVSGDGPAAAGHELYVYDPEARSFQLAADIEPDDGDGYTGSAPYALTEHAGDVYGLADIALTEPYTPDFDGTPLFRFDPDTGRVDLIDDGPGEFTPAISFNGGLYGLRSGEGF